MWSDVIKRPNYRDGQYLGAKDFVAALQYPRDMRRRLNLGHHTWGIFVGLDLEERPRDGDPTVVDIYITPGFAVDGFGREIFLFAPCRLEPHSLQGFTDEWVAVWLRYATEQTDPPRYGYERCDDPDLAYRTLETYRVELGRVTREHDAIRLDGRAVPDSQLPADLSVPYQALPDDEEHARWLIPLGFVHWDAATLTFRPLPSDPTARRQELQQRARGRRYGGVVGAELLAPAGRLTVRDRLTASPIAAPAPGVIVTLEGSLGIRTPDPRRFLHVEGNEIHSGGSGAGLSFGNRQTAAFAEAPANGERWVLYADDGNARLWSGTDKLLLTPAGRVGIGTQTPQRALHVEPSEIHSGGAGAGFSFGNRQTPAFTEVPAAGQRWVWYASDGLARLWSGVDKLVVTPGGNVGIGTAAPQQSLSVQGGLNVDQANANPGTVAPGISFGSASGEGIASRRTAGANQFGLDFYTGFANRMVITSGGNVGIATTTPAFRLDMVGDGRVQGRLGTGGFSPVPLTPGWGGGIHTWDVEAEGTIWSRSGFELGDGAARRKVPVDVLAGEVILNLTANASGTHPLDLVSRLPNVTDAQLIVALSDIGNVNQAFDARWTVFLLNKAKTGANSFRFNIRYVLGDSDGILFSFSYVAVFIP